jgi:hypothetical protein
MYNDDCFWNCYWVIKSNWDEYFTGMCRHEGVEFDAPQKDAYVFGSRDEAEALIPFLIESGCHELRVVRVKARNEA